MTQIQRGITFLITFFLFSFLVAGNYLGQFDQTITIILQSLLSTSLDIPLSLLSLLGSFEVTTLILFGLIFFLKTKRGLMVLILFAVGMGIELLGKIFLYHPGPPSVFFRYSLDVLFPSAYVQTGHSFPSGHSFRTAFLTYLINYLISRPKIHPTQKKIYSAICYLILFLMLLSRISLGEHWTTDVIGGSLLGFGLASFAVSLLSGYSRLNLVK